MLLYRVNFVVMKILKITLTEDCRIDMGSKYSFLYKGVPTIIEGNNFIITCDSLSQLVDLVPGEVISKLQVLDTNINKQKKGFFRKCVDFLRVFSSCNFFKKNIFVKNE